MMAALVPALTGLGLFFCGVRFLATSLAHVAGPSARRLFRTALASNWLAAFSGILSGLVTQSTNAVALIVVSFARAGILQGRRAPLVPTWSHVGASALVFLVALDTGFIVAYMLILSGVAFYFDFRLSDRMRHGVMALLGAGMLLLGLSILKAGSAPLEGMLQGFGLLGAESSGLSTLLVGVALALATQSSTVAGAIAVALVGAGVFDLDTAILLLLGANGGSGLNYAFLARHGEATGRHILLFQALQKLAGTLILLLPFVVSGNALTQWLQAIPTDDAHRLALVFLVMQIIGSLACTLALRPFSSVLHRYIPPRHEDELAKPAFLVEEALDQGDLALDLAEKESHRLLQRLPLMLEQVREGGNPEALSAHRYREAGHTVGAALNRYLAEILDRQPDTSAIVRTMSLQQSVTNTLAMHDALAEFFLSVKPVARSPDAQVTMGHLVESLHMLLDMLATTAMSGDPQDRSLALSLFGQRDELMESIRMRLLDGDRKLPTQAQHSLFQATLLFERIIWLARNNLHALIREPQERTAGA